MSAPLGVFARVFPRGSADEVAEAIRAAGFTQAQLNLSCIGLPTIPSGPVLADLDLVSVGHAFRTHGLQIWGVSLTFNLIHPDRERRRRELDAAVDYLGRIAELGPVATICTGTRDPDDMWRAHPDNTGRAAWSDLRAGLDELLAAARAGGVRLGIEPERGNVVRDAPTARRLLDELGPAAGDVVTVLDPANLITMQTLGDQDAILREAVDLLGDSVGCLHAKDVVEQGYAAAGVGGLDYDLVADLWSELPGQVPIVAQDCTEQDAARVHDLLRTVTDRHPRRVAG